MIRRCFRIFSVNFEKMPRITLFLNVNITRVPKKFRSLHFYPRISAAYALAQRNQQKKNVPFGRYFPNSTRLIRLFSLDYRNCACIGAGLRQFRQ